MILSDNSFKCYVYNHEVILDIEIIESQNITDANANIFINFFKTHIICEGIDGFEEVIFKRLDPLPNANLETTEHLYLPCRDESSKIRHKDCQFFIKPGDSLCKICSKLQKQNIVENKIENRGIK